MILNKLEKDKLIHPPKWLSDNTFYLTQMGSVAYACSGSTSDIDVYGACFPPKEMIFPHLTGEIPGFGRQIQRFNQWQESHIVDKNTSNEYDFQIYGIVRYFQLLMVNNPNIIDSIFTPDRCVLYRTNVSDYIRENRRMFLHKGAIHKFRGYAYSQMSKIKNKTNSSNPSRQENIQKWGFDIKFAYHVIRLALEAEQIAIECDLDLERNSEILKSVRRGEWTLKQIEDWMESKMKSLETTFTNSKIPDCPDEDAIKKLLIHCLEMKYGSLDDVLKVKTDESKLLEDLKNVIKKYE